jgi:hypothetical protein
MRSFMFIISTVMRRKKFIALNVPRQCQLVLLVKVGCKQRIALRSKEGSILGEECCSIHHKKKKLNIWSEV